MLELRDAELELVEVVTRHEVELVDERADRVQRAFRQPGATASQTGGKLNEELLEDVGDPLATGRGHAASCAGAGAASPGVPARQDRTATPARRRRAPA